MTSPAPPAAPLARALADRLRRLSPLARRAILAPLTARQLAALLFEWRRFWARPDQLPPEEAWTFLAFIGGRGSGKTRSAAEYVVERVRLGRARRVHLVGATYDDARETMIVGPSGILACSPPEERPSFESSIAGGLLRWPNGAYGRVFSAEEPKRLRGPQCDTLWCDDIAAWGTDAEAAWRMAMLGFRLGDPRCVISTTPLATELLISLIKDRRRGMVIQESITDDNRGNLARTFFDDVLKEFEGTHLEAQERYGKLLVDVDDTLFKSTWIVRVATPPELERIVVAVDPAVTEEAHSDETGIVVIGLGVDGRLYVLADFTGKHSAQKWAALVAKAFRDYQADCVVAETNRGGNLVRRNLEIEAPNLPIREVTASRGKVTRAEPVALAYEKGLVVHVIDGPAIVKPGPYRMRKPYTLEEEIVTWNPKKSRSPNGIDALVWGAAELKPFDASTQEPAPPMDEYEEAAGGSGFDLDALRWRE